MPEFIPLAAHTMYHDEGVRFKLYRCTGQDIDDPRDDKLSIGVGRNVQDTGISEDEAAYFLATDLRLGRECDESVFYPLATEIKGQWYIGHKRNLSQNGINECESDLLLINSIIDCIDALERYRWWGKLNDPRKAAIINMVYQLGTSGFHKFKNTRRYLDLGLWHHAAIEARDSVWYRSAVTQKRATRVTNIIDSGKFEGYPA